MPSLGPNPRATGLLNCILKPASILSREGVSSCLAAGTVTQLPLNLGKGAEDRGRCLASSSSSRHPTLSADRLSTRLSLPTQSLGHPCLGFPSQPRQPFCWVRISYPLWLWAEPSQTGAVGFEQLFLPPPTTGSFLAFPLSRFLCRSLSGVTHIE